MLAITAATALAAPLAFAGSPAPATTGTTDPAEQPATAETTYVDWTAEAAEADGTKEHPLTSLDAVNELGLDAGDQVLFHRGSTCTGTLVPNGSGKAGQPVVIGAYGTGEAPLLDAAGAHDVILLENVEHITVQDLAVTK